MYEADYLTEYAAKSSEGLSLPKLLLKHGWFVVLMAIVAFALSDSSPGDLMDFLTRPGVK